MLEGFHDDWVNAGNNRILTFTNVPGGDYVLRLKASESGATMGDEYSSLSVHIDTVYFKTIWFRTLMAVVALTIIYAIYMFRQRQKRAIEMLRQKIAADLHDDIGSTLSSIRLYSDVAVKSPGDSGALLEKISRNSSSMIDRMSDIVWAIKPGYDDLQTLAGRLRDFAVELCGPAEIEFEFHFDENLIRLRPGMELKKELYLTMKEAISNAVKHSGCKKLTLSFNEQKPNMVITVQDDGKGFSPDYPVQGNGLRNMKMRAERMRGKFSIENRDGSGTRVVVSVPFTLFG
jgi:signal transduction histidine kinase